MPILREMVGEADRSLMADSIADCTLEQEELDKFELNRGKGNNERNAMQKKTFTKWVNKHLTKAGLIVEDLFEDLCDGKALIALLEALTDESIQKENGKTRFHRIQNVQTCLDFLKKKSVKLVNIRSEDIVDGNEKLTMGLIWTIILHFQVSVIRKRLLLETQTEMVESKSVSVVEEVPGKAAESSERVDVTSARVALLQMAQKVTSDYPLVTVTNFSSSWRDGLAFNAIIHHYRPAVIDWYRISDESVSNRERLENAFTVAEREFEVPRLLDAEDVDTNHPDEKSIITYVSSLYNALPEQPASNKWQIEEEKRKSVELKENVDAQNLENSDSEASGFENPVQQTEHHHKDQTQEEKEKTELRQLAAQLELEELKRLENWKWHDWKERYFAWMDKSKSCITDLFRLNDPEDSGLVPRELFIDGVIESAFPTSRLEMEKAADRFDKGDGMIDIKDFADNLRLEDRVDLQNNAEFRADNVNVTHNQELSKAADSIDAASPHFVLLQKIQEATANYPVVEMRNFSSSWRDGLAFNAMIHNYCPAVIDWPKICDKLVSNRERLENAFDVAEREFGVPRLLDADDVDSNNPNHELIVNYVSYLQNTLVTQSLSENWQVNRKEEEDTEKETGSEAQLDEQDLEEEEIDEFEKIAVDLNAEKTNTLESWKWEDWEKRFSAWMDEANPSVDDLFHSIDSEHTGWVPRKMFIDGVIGSEFPTSRLEMEKVADRFDRGDGMIDIKDFAHNLHLVDRVDLQNNAGFRADNVIVTQGMSKVETTADVTIAAISPHATLLQKIQEATADYPQVKVRDFTSSWFDGLAFNALIHHYRPDLIDWRKISDQSVSNRVRLENAFIVAEKKLGVPHLLDPEDVDTHYPDEELNFTYISSVFNALQLRSTSGADDQELCQEISEAGMDRVDFENPIEEEVLMEKDLNEQADDAEDHRSDQNLDVDMIVEEVKRLGDWKWHDWKERFSAWIVDANVQFNDLLSRFDSEGTGLVPREVFIDRVIGSKFPTSRLEMEKVADKFDRGDGMIDSNDFVNAIRFEVKRNELDVPDSQRNTEVDANSEKITKKETIQVAETMKENDLHASLLQRAREITADYPQVTMSNFSSSWRDGLAFNAIIHYYCPAAIDWPKISDKLVSNRERLENAFDVAEKEFGVARLLDSDNVDHDINDEDQIFNYVSSLIGALPCQPAPKKVQKYKESYFEDTPHYDEYVKKLSPLSPRADDRNLRRRSSDSGTSGLTEPTAQFTQNSEESNEVVVEKKKELISVEPDADKRNFAELKEKVDAQNLASSDSEASGLENPVPQTELHLKDQTQEEKEKTELRQLADRLELEELKRLENWKWQDWKERYFAWKDKSKSCVTDLFRLIDPEDTGLVPRELFIDGVIGSAFPTSRLEMEKAADRFDKGDGMIDIKDFADNLRLEDRVDLQNNAELRADNVSITQELIKVETTAHGTIDAVSPHFALLQKIQEATANYPQVKVRDFTSSWRDGLAFNAMIHNYCPAVIDWPKICDKLVSNRERLENAFDVAEREFGVLRLLDVEVVDTNNPNHELIVNYVSSLISAISSSPNKHQPKYKPEYFESAKNTPHYKEWVEKVDMCVKDSDSSPNEQILTGLIAEPHTIQNTESSRKVLVKKKRTVSTARSQSSSGVEEMKKLERWQWKEWRTRFSTWMDYFKINLADLLQRIDAEHTGLVPREVFIEKVIGTEFPTSRLEMEKVAGRFDRGDGMIDIKHFADDLHFEDKVEPRNSERSRSDKFNITPDNAKMADSIDTASPHVFLLQTIREVTADYPQVKVRNFTSSWRDGLAFNAIIHHYCPAAIDWPKISDQSVSNRERLENAFTVAEREFGSLRLLNPEDVDTNNIDEELIFNYVASLFSALPLRPTTHQWPREKEFDSERKIRQRKVEEDIRQRQIQEEKEKAELAELAAKLELEELKRLENWKWQDWKERYVAWMDDAKSRVTDLFRRIDSEHTGLVPRELFIDGVIGSKFPTSRLEMEKVADRFDKDGMIDSREFINAIRFERDAEPDTDPEKIKHEIERQKETCSCCQPFSMQKISENQYKFGDTQIKRMVRILRSTVMVRVGGGWETLEEFLQKHDPCRARGRLNTSKLPEVKPENASDLMRAFTKNRHALPAPGTPGPVVKIREKTVARSVPMSGGLGGTAGYSPCTPSSSGTPKECKNSPGSSSSKF